MTGITDGTSNTLLVGSKPLATQVYSQRGCSSFTSSNGGSQPCYDDPITNPGNEKPGTVRSWGPDTTWYIAGANSAPIDPNNPYKTDIPGSTYRIKPGWNWYYSTFTVDQDTLDRKRQILGEDHPDTLISASNLALDLRILGQSGSRP